MDAGLVTEDYITGLLDKPQPFNRVSCDFFNKFGADTPLPDGGRTVKLLADKTPGGAFDPRDLGNIPSSILGYSAKWVNVRYNYYGLDWDISGLRMESLNTDAENMPFIVIIHGGAANFYEFFLNPLNEPGMGQYLAQKINVLLVNIPGNFKYGGWTESDAERAPQYLLDQDISSNDVMIRNAIYTNKLVVEGLKKIILQETSQDILILGHAKSGDLVFFLMGESELAGRLKGRFLGWGSGGPPNLFKEWEIKIGRRERMVGELAKYPPIWQLRNRNAAAYLKMNYLGPLHPCRKPGMEDVDVAERWFFLEKKRRPNFNQVMVDIEHHGMDELKAKVETELEEILARTGSAINTADVFRDLYAAKNAPLEGYKKMVWTVGKLDPQHWDQTDTEKALEMAIANQFRKWNPGIAIRILLFDLPLTQYGHIEMPGQMSAALLGVIHWHKKSLTEI